MNDCLTTPYFTLKGGGERGCEGAGNHPSYSRNLHGAAVVVRRPQFWIQPGRPLMRRGYERARRMAWLFPPILPSLLVSLPLECHSCWSNCGHRESPRPYLLEKSEQSRVRTPGAKDHLGCWSTSQSLTPTRRRTTFRRSAWRSRERVAGTWSCCEHRGLC